LCSEIYNLEDDKTMRKSNPNLKSEDLTAGYTSIVDYHNTLVVRHE